jgi:hypothetical protein
MTFSNLGDVVSKIVLHSDSCLSIKLFLGKIIRLISAFILTLFEESNSYKLGLVTCLFLWQVRFISLVSQICEKQEKI